MSDRKSVAIHVLALYKALGPILPVDASAAMDIVRAHYLASDLLVEEIVTGSPRTVPVQAQAPATSSTEGYLVDKVEDHAEKLRVHVQENVADRGWFTLFKNAHPADVASAVVSGVRISGTITKDARRDGKNYWTIHGAEVVS